MEQNGEVQQQLSIEETQRLAQMIDVLTVIKENEGQKWREWNDPQEAQKEFDKVYSREFEETKKEKDASRDIKGRPVTYWRNMSIKALQILLEKGEITALDYHKELLDEDDRKALAEYLSDYEHHLKWVEDPQAEVDFVDVSVNDTLDFAKRLFPNEREELLEALFATDKATNWKDLMDFLNTHLDLNYVKQRHSGGDMKRFSPYMSLSVASPLLEKIYNSTVYVEFVIPDTAVQVNDKNGAVGEREVLSTRLTSQWVARVYIDNKMLYQDFMNDPNTAFYQFTHDPENKKLLASSTQLDAFRWRDPIQNTLPEGMLKK
jgi:hypothetical protein